MLKKASKGKQRARVVKEKARVGKKKKEKRRGMGRERLKSAPVLLLIAAVLVQGRYLSAWNGAGSVVGGG